ncbi:hypothetical protein [Paenibacillus sp. FSL H7-0331]|uniref:hypothetical protein n=1 Tax=Paenibacillus sp. FSL H7-0331 TaxID=1920421 RepID=UPI00096C8E38|nr:hypothetical protein [Paenibacillus sp. FSL H7-0331]OMF06963.1 hypothetical protein BK127_30505 [Paenibacillus sp. FSL H7-0331]
MKTYEADPFRVVYAYYKETKDAAAAAIIGLKLDPEQKDALILHIAVDHSALLQLIIYHLLFLY